MFLKAAIVGAFVCAFICVFACMCVSMVGVGCYLLMRKIFCTLVANGKRFCSVNQFTPFSALATSAQGILRAPCVAK